MNDYPHPDYEERQRLRASVRVVLDGTGTDPHEVGGVTTFAGHAVRLALVVDELVQAEAAEAGRDKRSPR